MAEEFIITNTELRFLVDRTIDQTLKALGIKAKTRKSSVTFNYAVTMMGIGRRKLETALRGGKIDGMVVDGRWEIDRKSIERYFKLT